MHNLVLLQRRIWALEASSASFDQCVASASISGDDHVFFLRCSGCIESLHLDEEDVQCQSKDLAFKLDLRQCIELNDTVGHSWKWMNYVAELGALVCASTRGALVSVDLDTMEGEEVGCVDSGLRAVAWSDNQEVVALITGAGSLLVMGNDWKILYEVEINAFLPSGSELWVCEPYDNKWLCELCWRDDSAFVALNIATNIQGEDRMEQKLMTFTAQLEFHALGRHEDGRALSTLGKALDWSQRLALIASSEVRKGRWHVVFFEANGLRHGEFSTPASYCSPEYEVGVVRWNSSSDILAVSLHGSENGDDSSRLSKIQLWSRNNYHWFLKQELTLKSNDGLVSLAWDEEKSGRLNIVACSFRTQALTLYEYEFAWDCCCLEAERLQSSALRDGEETALSHSSVAVTAVIDGAQLLLTPLHQAIVPPPFALHETTFDAAINSVAFDAQGSVLLVLLATGDVILVNQYLVSDASASFAGLPPAIKTSAHTRHVDALMQKVPVKLLGNMTEDPFCTLSSILWIHFDAVSGRLDFAGKTGRRDHLVLCTSRGSTTITDDEIVVSVRLIELFGVRRACEVLWIHDEAGETIADKTFTKVAIQTHSGAMYTLNVFTDDEVVPIREGPKLPTFSHMTVLASLSTTSSTDGSILVIGHERSSARLYVNNQVLASACTSFKYSLPSSVLLFTTQGRESRLCIASLSSIQRVVSSPMAMIKFESRSIERGALLVAIVNCRASVIVEMPRGNLECMSPRVLVLALVIQHIQAREYVMALEICRRHRLDLNLLVDFNPQGFLEMVSQRLVHSLLVTRPATVTSDRLCLFITNLHVVDVWTTKYAATMDSFAVEHSSTTENKLKSAIGDAKVNTVCQEVMRVIQDVTRDGNDPEAALLLPYITSAVKQSPPRFDEALGPIQLLLSQAKDANSPLQKQYQSRATRAIKHLIMLTNVDTLYSEALGLYDLDLVQSVATHSQRDPKEYVPFLDHVASLSSTLWRKYTIDVHLKRYPQALDHIAALLEETKAHDEAKRSQLHQMALSLIQQGELYDQAMTRFFNTPRDTDRVFRQTILRLKGEYLHVHKQYEAAGYVFLVAEDKEKARRSFLAARKWQMAFALCGRDQESRDEIRREAYVLAQEMLSNDQPQRDHTKDLILAVSRIYIEYCNDINEAIALLVVHHEWTEALRLSYLHQRNDLIESDIEPGVLQCFDDVLDELEVKEREYCKYWKRYSTIREQKRLFKLHGIDGSRWEFDKNQGRDKTEAGSIHSGVSSALDSALSYASASSVGSHNSAASIGNFAMQSLSMATASHFYATHALGDACKNAGLNAKRGRRERRKRMKEGSAEEEAYVAQQLLELRPNEALVREVTGLLEILVVLGYVPRAQKLQTQLARFEHFVAENQGLERDYSRDMDAKNGDALESRMYSPWRLEALQD
ncbi:hypothetical protein CCR75_003808 [Bremia lactucae]|uniref:Elongator complex protein 1 n=1 Tax=Bremia lactucae TaxID=4779 RepID=A0A976FKK4_BRELC|nr:hypothetical protein CCR75_003808 [Bremia lactucae]